MTLSHLEDLYVPYRWTIMSFTPMDRVGNIGLPITSTPSVFPIMIRSDSDQAAVINDDLASMSPDKAAEYISDLFVWDYELKSTGLSDLSDHNGWVFTLTEDWDIFSEGTYVMGVYHTHRGVFGVTYAIAHAKD